MAEVKMDDLRDRFPANDGSQQRPAQVELEPIDDISVEKKPRSVVKKACGILGGKDMHEVVDYVVNKIVVPGVRDIFFDTVVGGLSMKMYGTDRGYRTQSRGITDYNSISRGPSTKTKLVREARPMVERVNSRARTVYVDDLVFDDRGVAYEVLDRLITYLRDYHSVSVANLYQLCKIRTNPTDFEWGWYDLNENVAYVKRHGGKFMLVLPDPVPLNDDAPF